VTVATAVHLDGAFNVRAFTAQRSRNPWLVRSSALDALTPEGVGALRKLGVVRVIDLRSPGEGDPAAHDIAVSAMPAYDPAEGVPATGRLEDVLERLIDTRGEALAGIIGAIAETDGAVAVHCTIGKDRTGLVIALTLLAAGVSEHDVIADYVLSGPEVFPHRRGYVERMLSGMELNEEQLIDAWRLNVDSPPEVMHHVLAILEPWGGAEGYLMAHGLSLPARQSLRARMRRP
jgi:protein-tyrosine phosphatase